MAAVNRQLRLASRPRGVPTVETWQLTELPVSEPGDSELVVKVSHISLDPAMRGWLDDVRSYMPPVMVGEVMRAAAAGQVVASRDRSFPEGSFVSGMLGVQEYATCDGREVIRIDPARAPLGRYLGALGLTGLTAYFGMLEIGRPKPDDTVLVSGAAGAVGSIAGQLAALHGARVVGIAGGPEKCAWLTDELGFDAALDYKTGGLREGLRRAAPEGVDIYFDNVGGETLNLALARLSLHARVVICGAISQYNATQRPSGPANYLSLLINRASMTGLLVFDYQDRYREATERLAQWLHDGKLIAREHTIIGALQDFPDALLELFAGGNTGKLVLELADSESKPQRRLDPLR